ncbi:universal stress protein UspC [Erwinia sp. CPCC 100877]|nr:universal stress protein UspC [Erwinia sp. CPCC 100877]
MSWRHLLVAVAATPESDKLVEKAVELARPREARISLLTVTADPECYNQMAAPMLGSLRELLREESQMFLNGLCERAGYPIDQRLIVSGELSNYLRYLCRNSDIDLIIYGNHNQNAFSKALCSARSVVATSNVDVLLVALNPI